MIPFLGALGAPRLLLYAAVAAAALGALGYAYGKGRADGRALEAGAALEREAAMEAKQAKQRDWLQQAIEARNREIERRQQAAAAAASQVRVEYLPGKTLVRREVVERPVFRDCRIGDGLRDTIDAALRGAPIAGTAGGSRADGMPSTAADAGG